MYRILVFLLSLVASVACARDVTLAWDASESPDAVGYRLYIGQESGQYTQSVDAGATLQRTVADLADDQDYYFAATAYNSEGGESGFSNEVVMLAQAVIPEDQINVVITSTLKPPSTRVTDGQILLYTFDEGGGDTILDLSGFGAPLDLTVSNPNAVSWLPGGGLAINSQTTIRSAASATKVRTALQASQALTLEAWVVPSNTTQDGPARIVALSLDPSPGGANFVLGQDQTHYSTRLRTTTTDAHGRPALTAPTGTATTVLTHLVYTRDASGTARFYVNGVEEASGTVSGNFSNWGDYLLTLANDSAPDGAGVDRPWLGELHLVAVYDRALTPGEVVVNFEAGY